MTRKERLMATLRGESVDRPAVNFYEIGGFAVNPTNPDPFNVYNAPSWQPLLEIAEEESDIIRFCSPTSIEASGNCRKQFFVTKSWTEGDSSFVRVTVHVAGRTLTSLRRIDAEVDTWWQIEHLLKTSEDAEAYLQLPDECWAETSDVSSMFKTEQELGDRGIVMMNISDPIGVAAPLFSMQDYLVIALTEPELFHRLLQQAARILYPQVEEIASKFPGRLWRVCGPEYAVEPYLAPRFFKEYVTNYTKPIVEIIQKHGGYARLHCHGRIKNVLPYIMEMNPDGLDPIEPPTQGDVRLIDVRQQHGTNMVLFGNIEVSDIEYKPTAEFENIAAKAIREGTTGQGRGFVLMPSSAPCGRNITEITIANYRTMIRLANAG